MADPPYEGAIVDLDGTVYLGSRLVPGADEGVATLREAGLEVVFFTNKAVERRETYCEKLTGLGIPVGPGDVITSGTMTAEYLAEHYPTEPVFVVGEAPLREELRERGLRLTDDPADAGVVLASMDRHFDYERLTDAMRAMEGAAAFVATNPDRTCPTADGEIPDCAAMVGAIQGATGREVETVVGKPSRTAIDAATTRLGVEADRCILVGDRLETDVRMGNRAGMTTVLVLSGVTDRETLRRSSTRPDHVVDSLADVGTVLER